MTVATQNQGTRTQGTTGGTTGGARGDAMNRRVDASLFKAYNPNQLPTNMPVLQKNRIRCGSFSFTLEQLTNCVDNIKTMARRADGSIDCVVEVWCPDITNGQGPIVLTGGSASQYLCQTSSPYFDTENMCPDVDKYQADIAGCNESCAV